MGLKGAIITKSNEKRLGIIIFVLGGSILGFGAHLFWHSLAGVYLFSSGPHVIQGVTYTLVGMLIGLVLRLVLTKR